MGVGLSLIPRWYTYSLAANEVEWLLLEKTKTSFSSHLVVNMKAEYPGKTIYSHVYCGEACFPASMMEMLNWVPTFLGGWDQ